MASNSEVSEVNVNKSRRPAESAFKQQRLPAWQPILTAGTVLPTFFVIGIAFIPVGIGLLFFSDEVREYNLDYTNCFSVANPNTTCAQLIAVNNSNPKEVPTVECKCKIDFFLDKDFRSDKSVYIYYGLTNYYQNHRRYVKSRDDNQLLGRLQNPPSSDCEPYRIEASTGKPIVPCGAIANSMFNDVLTLHYNSYSAGQETKVPVLRTGIAWTSDKQIKFRNPPGSLEQAFKDTRKPLYWKKELWELDLENPDNNGFQNEDLIVWMRTAALPTFRKLYRIVDKTKEPYTNGLPTGNYTLEVDYNYPVQGFGGKKSMIISTTSFLGGKNPFLGVAYIVVGCLCLVLGFVLLLVHIKCSKSTTEMINVNPRTPYS